MHKGENMNKTELFIEAAKSQVGKGIYVRGGNGENLLAMDDPTAWIRKHETSSADAKRAQALFALRKRQGIAPIQAFDCSGLVYWCNKEAKIGYGDNTANGYFRECYEVEELKAGDLVFHHNGLKCTHVGIYIGDGNTVESFGRDDGVIITTEKTRKDKNYWNRKGRLKKLSDEKPKVTLLGDVNCDGDVTSADASLILRYIDGLSDITEQGLVNADVNMDGKVDKDDADAILSFLVGLGTLPPTGSRYVVVLGRSVSVRSGDNKNTKRLGIVHKDDSFHLLGVSGTGWYEIKYKGNPAYISNRSDLTKII